MKSLGLVADNDLLRGCEGMINRITKQVGIEVTPGILEQLDTVLRRLGGYDIRGKSDAEKRVFIELVLAVQDLCLYLSKGMPPALRLCRVATDLAIERGDLRLKAILALAEGMLLSIVGERFSGAGSSLSECIGAIEMLGDRDIQLRSSIFLVTLYYFRGDMKKILHYHEMAAFHIPLWNCRFLSELFSVSSCAAAHMMGNFPLAVGIADSGYRRATIRGLEVAEAWWALQLIAVLLSAGGSDAVIRGYLRRAESIVTPKQHTAPFLGLLQVKACYYFNRNDLPRSYELMATFFDISLKYGVQKPPFGPASTLELCVEFRRRGYPSFVGVDLDGEISQALTGENRVMEGVALRAQGLFAFDGGASPKAVADLLRQSAEVFREAGCLLYLGHTETMLHHLRGAGRGDRDVLSPANVFKIKTRVCEMSPGPANLVRQCAGALKAMPPWGDIMEYFQRGVCLFQREFRAERVALLRIGQDSRLECVAACNITEAEVRHGAFNLTLPDILKSVEQAKSVPITTDSFLAVSLPLQIYDGRSWVLYAESRYIGKPFHDTVAAVTEELELLLSAEFRSAIGLHEAREAKRIQPQCHGGSSMAYYGELMQSILTQAHQAAVTDATILILGETGVGKELFARSIHEASGRAGAFIPVHPASMAETLIESELFGHEKGAFTGAVKQKTGFFEMANEGTLFIDEVGEIPSSLQVKLLRVLQDRTFTRVGGTQAIHSRFRLVAATNRDLRKEVREGRFREDLFYRLFVVPFTLPPLRERGNDIVYLARIFLDHFAKRYNKHLPDLTAGQVQALESYAWPGNIRELKGVIERAAILSDGTKLTIMLQATENSPEEEGQAETLYSDLPTLKELQKRYLKHVLTLFDGNVAQAEGILGVKRSTLYAQLKRFGLTKKQWRDAR